MGKPGVLDKFKETNPKVVEELIPNLLSLGKVQKVLQNLLKEQISIRDLRTILEQLSDYASLTQDADILTEYVRQSLARPITKQYQSTDGTLSVLTLARWKRPSYSSARSASIGISILHGAHQSAQKSTATGLSWDCAMTSISKVVALTSVMCGVSSIVGDRVC